MKDERIQATVSKFAAIGFLIWWVLTGASLNYRVWILKQHPREVWDILGIFCICTFFVFIACANKGVFDHDFKRRWLTIGIVNLITFLTLFSIMGLMNSVADVGGALVGFLLGMGMVIAMSYFLNRRWKRREGIEDEKCPERGSA